jgi:hypothetical protein
MRADVQIGKQSTGTGAEKVMQIQMHADVLTACQTYKQAHRHTCWRKKLTFRHTGRCRGRQAGGQICRTGGKHSRGWQGDVQPGRQRYVHISRQACIKASTKIKE